MEPSTVVSLGALLVSAGVSWGVSKATHAQNTKEITSMRAELAEARRLAAELRTALVGISGDNGIASEVRQQRRVAEQNNTMMHELRSKVELLMERRSNPR